MRLTLSPRLSRRHPIEAAASPLPNEDTTPPVTKMYFADIASSLCFDCAAGASSGTCFGQNKKPTRVHGAPNWWARLGGGWRARSIMAENPVEGNVEMCEQAGGWLVLRFQWFEHTSETIFQSCLPVIPIVASVQQIACRRSESTKPESSSVQEVEDWRLLSLGVCRQQNTGRHIR